MKHHPSIICCAALIAALLFPSVAAPFGMASPLQKQSRKKISRPIRQTPAASLKVPPEKRAGLFMTSSGSLNILFVYAQFPDDRYLSESPNWPKGKPPAYMDATVDSAWRDTATPGSFTDYFNRMSFGKLKITGRCVSVITPHTRAWYLQNKKRRDFITQETLEQLDRTLDFAPFDHWTIMGAYSVKNAPDGVVDMIVMAWRNVCNDTADVRAALDLVPGGEASLGYGGSYTVDGGARTIRTGFGASGSGVTTIHPLGGDLSSEIIFKYERHEFGHWLLGSNDYHTSLGTWGLVDGWGTPSGCMNAFERNRLGWITPTTISDVTTKRVIRNVRLTDYATTGAAYRIKVPGGGPDEYYWLENHQMISSFDVPDNNDPKAKGLYVLLQQDNRGSSVGVVSAEGRFSWTVPEQLPNIYGSGELPVFERGRSNPIDGYSKRQNIPWTWKNVPQKPAAIHYQLDPATGEVHKAPPTVFTGNGKDQFDLENARVFSPSSNPSSDLHHSRDKIGFEITDIQNGVITLTIYINTTEEASPAKPQDVAAGCGGSSGVIVTWSPNTESDVASGGGYNLYREIFAGASVLIPMKKVNAALLTKPSFTDAIDLSTLSGITKGAAAVYARYRVEAVDRSHKVSVKSESAECLLGGAGK